MSNYFVERNEKNTQALDNIMGELPEFCEDFFIGIESRTTPLTRINYARDLGIFFDFLVKKLPKFDNFRITELELKHLNAVTSSNIEKFLSYLSFYEHNGKKIQNNDKAKARKLAAVRSLFKYFFNKDKLDANVATKIEMPKIHTKEIIRLEVDEVVKLLDQTEAPIKFSHMQLEFNKHTRTRDLAILTLFLGTGIRISELVGLNLDDIDFNANSFRIMRKGGNQAILYFSDEVADALREYFEKRKLNKKTDDNALFLSLRNERIGVRAVEKLVKKYSSVSTPLKKITPHKLRSTYGTNLYRETGDIYMVADVLGHKDVNTTRKHYAAISEDIRKSAANKVKLRDN
ncbi:MAG: tyrosine-type recombinase/integrase [Christensenellaceae bacterium]|nr:tyrosine-type recombinase/integrase [Christensenellaceae bacterium]